MILAQRLRPRGDHRRYATTDRRREARRRSELVVHVIDSTGLWYLPELPNEQVAGTLRYSPQNGITLSLIGVFRPASHGLESMPYPVIHGVITDSPYRGKSLVTLLRCFRRRSSIAIPGFESEEIRANRAYVGTDHLVGEEIARFVSVRATYTHLSEWSGLTGPRNFATQREGHELIARHNPPPAVQLHVDGERRLSLVVDRTASTHGRRFEITENAQLRLSDSAGFTPEHVLREIIFPFGDLLTFAVNRPSPVEDVEFEMEQTANDRPGRSFNLLFKPVYQPADEPATSSPEMLFTWDAVGPRYPDLVERWFRLRREFRAALDVYFGLVYGPPAYLETKFRLLLTTLSLLIAGRIPDHAIREAIDALRRGANDSSATRWIDMLPSINELSLPDGLRAVLESHGELARVAGRDVSMFLTNLAVLNRRLFADEIPGETRPSLVLMVERLTQIARIAILEHLGFSPEEIMALIAQTRMYQYLATQES